MLCINLDFFCAQLENGSSMASMIAQGTVFPATAKSSAFVEDKPSSRPSGMASLRSTKGIIAVKNVINSSDIL